MGDYSQSSLFTDSPLVSMQRYQISCCNSNLHNTYNSVVRTPVPVVSLMMLDAMRSEINFTITERFLAL